MIKTFKRHPAVFPAVAENMSIEVPGWFKKQHLKKCPASDRPGTQPYCCEGSALAFCRSNLLCDGRWRRRPAILIDRRCLNDAMRSINGGAPGCFKWVRLWSTPLVATICHLMQIRWKWYSSPLMMIRRALEEEKSVVMVVVILSFKCCLKPGVF